MIADSTFLWPVWLCGSAVLVFLFGAIAVIVGFYLLWQGIVLLAYVVGLIVD
jgi:hypothetical protein